MISKIKIIAVVLVTAMLSMTGCARKETAVAKPMPMTAEASRVLYALNSRNDSIRTVRAIGKLTVYDGESEDKTDVAMVLVPPGGFRADAMDPIADVSASMGSEGKYIWVWLPQKNKIYKRRATRSNLRRFAHIDSKLEDFIYMLTGSIPTGEQEVIEPVGSERGHFLFRMKGVELWMDKKGEVPYRIVRYREPPKSGGVRYEVVFKDYRKVGGVLFPYRIFAKFPAQGSAAIIEYTDIELNGEVSPDVFEAPEL
jgi:outer membrane lipoprotein-sorting protein